MAWLTGWSKRQPITLTGGSDGAQTDFQIKLAIAYDSDMQSDFDDLRFTKEDGETLIDSWLEDKTDGTSADVVVEFPSTPANGETQTYYMYYGKSDALDYWDIGDTFVYGDDFEDGSLATGGTAPWTQISGTTVESGGIMTFDEAYEEVETSLTNTINVWEIDIQGPFDTNGRGVSFNFMQVDASNYYRFAAFRSSAGTESMRISKFVSDTETSLLQTNLSLGNGWHTYKIIRDADGNFEMFLDGTSEGTVTDTTFTTSNNMRLKEIYNVAETINFDNLKVRKYAANPPTYEFGSEESESGGLSMAIVMHHLKQQRIS